MFRPAQPSPSCPVWGSARGLSWGLRPAAPAACGLVAFLRPAEQKIIFCFAAQMPCEIFAACGAEKMLQNIFGAGLCPPRCGPPRLAGAILIQKGNSWTGPWAEQGTGACILLSAITGWRFSRCRRRRPVPSAIFSGPHHFFGTGHGAAWFVWFFCKNIFWNYFLKIFFSRDRSRPGLANLGAPMPCLLRGPGPTGNLFFSQKCTKNILRPGPITAREWQGVGPPKSAQTFRSGHFRKIFFIFAAHKKIFSSRPPARPGLAIYAALMPCPRARSFPPLARKFFLRARTKKFFCKKILRLQKFFDRAWKKIFSARDHFFTGTRHIALPPDFSRSRTCKIFSKNFFFARAKNFLQKNFSKKFFNFFKN